MVAATCAWRDTPARKAARERMRAARAARVAERHAQQEREAGSCKVLLAGVDTLNLSSRGELDQALVRELTAAKETAAKQAREGAPLPVWRAKALGLDLEVQPYGSKKGALVLTSEAAVLILNPTGPRNLPRAYVELKSEFLWSGWERASDAAVELLREVSEAPASVDVQVSRVDLAVDFMGWQPTPDMLDHVIGRVVRRNQNFEPLARKPGEEAWWRVHGHGRRFTGFTFGGGQLLCRMYDKTVEIRKSGKVWFIPKWQQRGYVDEATSGHVWRLEFQIRREPLRKAELVTHAMKSTVDGPGSTEVKSWADLRTGLNELWRYLTRKWLAYRLPRTGRERVRIHPRWRILSDARFVDAPDGELFRHQRLWNMNRYVGALAGYIKRELPLQWKEEKRAPSPHRVEKDLVELLAKALAHYKLKRGEELYDAAAAEWRRHRALERLFSGKLSPRPQPG